jgi:hypothetical protein
MQFYGNFRGAINKPYSRLMQNFVYPAILTKTEFGFAYLVHEYINSSFTIAYHVSWRLTLYFSFQLPVL